MVLGKCLHNVEQKFLAFCKSLKNTKARGYNAKIKVSAVYREDFVSESLDHGLAGCLEERGDLPSREGGRLGGQLLLDASQSMLSEGKLLGIQFLTLQGGKGEIFLEGPNFLLCKVKLTTSIQKLLLPVRVD